MPRNQPISLPLNRARDLVRVLSHEELFGGLPTSYEICTLVHEPSDMRLNIEVSGAVIKISGSQGRPGRQRVDVREQVIPFSNGLDAVQRYQELIGERMVQGYTITHAGAVALRVADRIDDVRVYLERRQSVRQRENDRRITARARPGLESSRVVQAIAEALQQPLLLATPEEPPPQPAPAAESKPAEPRAVPGIMSKLKGKRKLLRE